MTPEALNVLVGELLGFTTSSPEVFAAVAEWALGLQTEGADRFDREVASFHGAGPVDELRGAIRNQLGFNARLALDSWARNGVDGEADPDFARYYEIMMRLAGAAEA